MLNVKEMKDTIHGLPGYTVMKELNPVNVSASTYQEKMKDKRAKEKIKKPANVTYHQFARTMELIVTVTSGRPCAPRIKSLETFVRKNVTSAVINCREILSWQCQIIISVDRKSVV